MQSETFDIRDVPQHYVAISKFGCHGKDKKASPEYQAVKRAYSAGEIDGIKFKRGAQDIRGQIFVDPKQAEKAIGEAAQRPVRRGAMPAGWPSPESIAGQQMALATEALESMDTTLDEIYRVLERLTAAVESIATQPKAAHSEVVAAIGSNGFHN